MTQKYPFSCEDLGLFGCSNLECQEVPGQIGCCSNPKCREENRVIHFHSACHPCAGTRTSFDKATDTLTIECRACQTHIIEILVAPSRVTRAEMRRRLAERIVPITQEEAIAEVLSDLQKI